MANYYLHDFTAADGTLWTGVGFSQVLGSPAAGFIATVFGNKGICKASAANDKQIYRSAYYPGIRDSKTKGTLDWKVTTNGREAGIGDRISNDGKQGYFFLADMNSGTPLVRLVRRTNGGETEIGGPIPPPGISAAHLAASPIFSMEPTTTEDSVRLVCKINGVVVLDVLDTSAARIEGGGGKGFYIGPTCQNDDITFDDLTAEDFEEDAGSGTDYQTGVGLRINGRYYSEQEWAALGLSPVNARQSYSPTADCGAIDDLNDAHQQVLKAGDVVGIFSDNVLICEGPIREVQTALQPTEGTRYTILSLRGLSDEVPIEDPGLIHGGMIPYNQDVDSELYDADRAAADCADILTELWESHDDGDDGLRIRGAASSSGSIFDTLPAMTVKPQHFTLAGTVTQAEETILGYMPEFAIFIDPNDKKRYVHDRSAASFKTISAEDDHVLATVTKDLRKARSVVIIQGGKPEAERRILTWIPTDLPGSDLEPAWHPDLDATVTQDRMKSRSGYTTVTASGIDGDGYCYVELDTTVFTMDPHEWDGTYFSFLTGDQAGNNYEVRSNGATRVTFTRTSWIGGLPPGAGDSIHLFGALDQGGADNGYAAWAREFLLEQGIEIVPGSCLEARIMNLDPNLHESADAIRVEYHFRHSDNRQVVKLELPALGLISRLPDPCAAGASSFADKVEITADVRQNDTHPDGPTRPAKKRIPALGWYGPAFSADSAIWGTGAVHHPGDPGVMTPHVINDANFVSDSEQGTEYENYANHVLKTISNIPYEAQFVYQDKIDTSWVGLNKRVRFLDPGRTLGFETTIDLWLLGVEYDFLQHTTTVICGTLSAFGIDIEKARDKYRDRTKADVAKRMARLGEDMRNCFQDRMNGAGFSGGDSSIPNADCNTATGYNYGGGEKPIKQSDLRTRVRVATVPDGECQPPCGPAICTLEGNAPGVMIDNANRLRGLCAKMEQTKLFNPTNGPDGAAGGNGGAVSVLQLAVALACNVADLWCFLARWSTAVDVQLMKGMNDFQLLIAAITALSACVRQQDDALCTAIVDLRNKVTTNINILNQCKWTASNTLCDLVPMDTECAPTTCPVDINPGMCDPPECKADVFPSCAPADITEKAAC